MTNNTQVVSPSFEAANTLDIFGDNINRKARALLATLEAQAEAANPGYFAKWQRRKTAASFYEELLTLMQKRDTSKSEAEKAILEACIKACREDISYQLKLDSFRKNDLAELEDECGGYLQNCVLPGMTYKDNDVDFADLHLAAVQAARSARHAT